MLARARRVLFVANAYPDGRRPFYGSFVRSAELGLRDAGVEVEVLAVPGYLGKREYGRAIGRFLSLERSGHWDVIHTHYGFMAYIGRLQLRTPLVATFTGGDLHGNPDAKGRLPLMGWLRPAVSRFAADLARATITKTAAMARLLPARTRARNWVIPDGVDVNRFGGVTHAEARARLGWPEHERTVLFAADPKRPVKNFSLAQAAVEELRTRMPEASLRVAAQVPWDDMPLWMAAADALLLTSSAEGSPNAVREAMASELPVVSTPVGDVPELLAGLPGCAVAPPSAAELAAHLEVAVAHRRLPEARAAMKTVDLRRTTAKTIAVYDAVLDGTA